MNRFFLLLALPLALGAAPRFTAERLTDHGFAIVRLTDRANDVQVSVAPSIGNRAYELKVHGQNLLYLGGGLPRAMDGVPFLAPWGNRIAGGGYWANGKRYVFNPALHNLNVSANGIAIHGMLTTSPLWEVTEVAAGKSSAHITSRLQFWKYPGLMANWPFAHEYEMTYTLSATGLQVAIAVKNLSTEPMPVVIGFHPYFRIPDVPRAEWSAHIPAKKHVEVDPDLIPTGTMTDSGLADLTPLRDHTYDDGFTDLTRDPDGTATFSIQAAAKKIDVVFGPSYKVALVFVPPKQEYVCFEPMAAITNALNLAHDGKYSELQTVAPAATWSESFWVRFSGF